MQARHNAPSTAAAAGDPARTSRDQVLRRRSVASTALWLLAAAGLVGWLALEAVLMGPLACELAPGTSIYGEAAWSWLQLGQVCTWELPLSEGGVDYARGPGLNRWLLVTVLVMWAASSRLLGNAHR